MLSCRWTSVVWFLSLRKESKISELLRGIYFRIYFEWAFECGRGTESADRWIPVDVAFPSETYFHMMCLDGTNGWGKDISDIGSRLTWHSWDIRMYFEGLDWLGIPFGFLCSSGLRSGTRKLKEWPANIAVGTCPTRAPAVKGTCTAYSVCVCQFMWLAFNRLSQLI